MQVLRPELDDVIISPFAVNATFASQGATLLLTLCCFCGVSICKGWSSGTFFFLKEKGIVPVLFGPLSLRVA